MERGAKVFLDGEQTRGLLARAADGDEPALEELFDLHRRRLGRMIRVRLDRRLRRRVDVEDVVQEVYVDATRRLGEYLRERKIPFFIWLRLLGMQKLAELHRRHVGAQGRDVRREQHATGSPQVPADSHFIAERICATLTSPSAAAMREEILERLLLALEEMSPADREVLVLRHFEQLDSAEVACELGIMASAASKRYIRALKRMRAILADLEDTER